MTDTTMFKMPAKRTQMWLARGAMAALVVLILTLKTFGPGNISSVKEGNTTTYYAPLLLPVTTGIFAIIICIMAFVFLMQPKRFYKAASAVLFATAVLISVNLPTLLSHRLIVTPDYFYHRYGAWFSPIETKVEFASLAYITTGESGKDGHGQPEYELQCSMKPDGNIIRIPLNDMTQNALPEILDRASQRDVLIDDKIHIPVK